MIKEAIDALDGKATNKQISKWVHEKYRDDNVKEGTIMDHIQVCTVNRKSRVNWPENNKSRICNDERYDFLYSTETAVVESYDKAKHGEWILVKRGGKATALSLEEAIFDFEHLKQFCLGRFRHSQSNYREIAIKILLESPGFTAEREKIVETVEKLNFDREDAPQEGWDTAVTEMIFENLRNETIVTYNDKDTTFRLLLSKDTTKEQVNELRKICGQAIANWHINKIAKNEFRLWRVKPGTEEEGWMYLDEFLETNSLGVGWNDLADLSGFESEDDVNDHIDKVKPGFNSKSSVTAISHKMSEKDLVVVTKAQKELVDYGIIVSKYEFEDKERGSYSHRRRVVWLSQGPVLKSDFPDEHFGGSLQAAHEVHDPAKKKFIDFLLGDKQREYFLLRHGLKGPWKDDPGKTYHVGRNKDGRMGNLVEAIRSAGVGTKTVWWTASGRDVYFWGFGTVSKIETITEDKDWNLKYDNFKFFEGDVDIQGRKLKKATEFINQQIHDLEDNSKETGFNWRQSINRIPKKIYEEITGDRSTMSAPTPENLDKFVRALKWKPNLILYGPPGTGKTWQAKRIAKSITSNQNGSDIIKEYRYLEQLTPEIKKQTWLGVAAKVLLENNGTETNYHNIYRLTEQILSPSTPLASPTSQGFDSAMEKYGNDSIFTHPSEGMYGLKVPTTFVKAAEIILFANNQPMKIQEIAKIITEKNMVETSGETPERTLSTEFLRDRENGENSKFIQTGSATYVLRRQIIQDGTDASQDSTTDSSTKKSNFMQQVTFHQSFSYEEFIEGIKAEPTTDGGGVTYGIDKGIFQRFCLRADKDDKNNYVMIIDEINRGNISKIFGELITIIEKDKRGERVTLAYSRDDFWVPENVFIIGTMNTADQSLTHLDAALKRRFTMMETPPDSNVLKHSKVEGVDLTNLLDAINKKLVEYKFRDRRIGHAYFMTKDENSGETEIIKKIEDLQMAFATDIIPVLRDHFYDQEDILMDVLGNEFLDWENDQDLKEDWQEDKEIFKEILKKAYGV